MSRVIDCDLPATAPPVSALHEHLDGYWRDTVVERGLRSIEPSYELPGSGVREPAMPAGAELAGGNPITAHQGPPTEGPPARPGPGAEQRARSRGGAPAPPP